MHLALCASVLSQERQRSNMTQSNIELLKNSIEEEGLLHAIVVDKSYNLIAGGRRLRACIELHMENRPFTYNGVPVPRDNIPIVIRTDDLSPLKLKEIELNENLIRENLSWQDETKALADIHALRKESNPDQTFAETSKEVIAKTSSSQNQKALADKISRATVTEKFLDRPEVQQAGNEKLAFNAAMRIARNEFAGELAKRKLAAGKVHLHNFTAGDAGVILGTISRTFRCFVLDPPYGVGADKFGNAADGRHTYNDSKEAALALNMTLIEECTKLATPDAHMWIFCDIDFVPFLKDCLKSQDWKVFRTPIVWNSGTSGHVPNQKTAIRRNYELILFASRSERGLAQMLDDVVRVNSKSGADEDHGAKKPKELYELFIKLSCNAGDYVLDPTCGSGTIFRAAEACNVVAFGIELDVEHAKNCEALLIELEREREKK